MAVATGRIIIHSEDVAETAGQIAELWLKGGGVPTRLDALIREIVAGRGEIVESDVDVRDGDIHITVFPGQSMLTLLADLRALRALQT